MILTRDKTELGFPVGTTIHDESVTVEKTRRRWLTRLDERVVVRGSFVTCAKAASVLVPERRRTGALNLPPFRDAA